MSNSTAQLSGDDLALTQLMNADQSTLLDLIDQLRGMGIDKDIKLPKIIVCGDQSSGKSSVLEAISGLSFPRGSGLCTTFATEVALRRSNESSDPTISVSIQPAHNQSKLAKQRLKAFSPSSKIIDDFEATIKAAKELLALENAAVGSNSYHEDVLQVKYSHPNAPQLTLVDLPGWIHVHNPGKNQTARDVRVCHDLVQRYMAETGSIMLIVVSAENDAANQEMLALAKKFDPEGVRTMGIITKPDRAETGGREDEMIKMADENNPNFKLGWHVLRNRGPSQPTSTQVERDQQEADFFKTSKWAVLKAEKLGIATLRSRLSDVLLAEIRLALPEVIPSIRTNLNDCKQQLDQLGDARETSLQQKMHLDKISRRFQGILTQALDGNYADRKFFGLNPSSDDPRRLRASLQNLNDKFAARMHEKGHRREIIEDSVAASITPGSFPDGHEDEQEKITRAGYLAIVRDLMQQNRGTELPGAVDPRLVRELFRAQSENWVNIARDHLEKTFELVNENLKQAVYHVADETTATKIHMEWIEVEMDKKRDLLMKKLKELVAPYQKRHPITYNSEYLEIVANIRKRNKNFFTEQRSKTAIVANSFDLAASDLLDSMEAFYMIALRTFVDNVAVLAVEMTLIAGLEEIFTPSNVSFMDDETLHLLGSELEFNQRKRAELKERLTQLSDALQACRRHASQTTSVASTRKKDKQPETPATPSLVPSSPLWQFSLSKASSAPRTPRNASGLVEPSLGMFNFESSPNRRLLGNFDLSRLQWWVKDIYSPLSKLHQMRIKTVDHV